MLAVALCLLFVVLLTAITLGFNKAARAVHSAASQK